MSQIAKMRERMIKEEQARKEMENMQTTLIQEKNQLFTQLQRVSLWGMDHRTGTVHACVGEGPKPANGVLIL